MPDGQIHVIMGKNGIGKSTLCKVIMNYPGYIKKGNIVKVDADVILYKDKLQLKAVW